MPINDELDQLREIRQFSTWNSIELIYKGWSNDRKYHITDTNGRQFLLRISDIDAYARKKLEFEHMKLISRLGIRMSIPIQFGKFAGGAKVYSLLSWVAGEDAEVVLPQLSKGRQYELGLKAGCILQKMHSVAAPIDQPSWEAVYKCKIAKLIERYQNCSISVPDEQSILQFIENNQSDLDSRPSTFQHGDYHVGNLVITTDDDIGVLDFNRCSFGDPWEEYDRFIFTWRVSIPFAVGQLHGYFDNDVPDQFFRLMALYNAVNIIASIPWAINFGESELNTMRANTVKIVQSYNKFETYIPSWYKKA